MDVSEIYLGLDGHGFEDVETTDRNLLLNDVLEEINQEAPWPWLKSLEVIDAEFAVDSSTGLVTLANAPIRAVRYVLDLTNTENRVRWVNEDDLIDAGVDFTLNAAAYHFYFVGQDLYFWPIPTSGTYRIGEYLIQEELDENSLEDDILMPARYHRLILLGMLARLQAQEDDPELYGLFKGQYDERMMRMRRDAFQQQFDRGDSIRVYGWDDVDDWEA